MKTPIIAAWLAVVGALVSIGIEPTMLPEGRQVLRPPHSGSEVVIPAVSRDLIFRPGGSETVIPTSKCLFYNLMVYSRRHS